jgi:hypothetical protein
MIYNQKYTPLRDRDAASNYLNHLQDNSPNKLRVLDVGGWHSQWAPGYITHVIDIQEVANVNFYIGNINMPYVWDTIKEVVEKEFKFDFCICTHTLEDIANPRLAIEMMPLIANEGFIAIPSKYDELRKNQYGFRGSVHHRWIYNIEKNNDIMAYPKINYLEISSISDPIGNLYNDYNQELQFFWKDDLPIKFINNDYLGPSDGNVFDYYNNLLD